MTNFKYWSEATGLPPILFQGERGLGDLEERFSSANRFHSGHESSWHPIKRIKSMFGSKPFPSTRIHLPFDFKFSCQDLNNLQHTNWHGSLQLKDKWEGEGRLLLHLARRLALNKITTSVCCCSNASVNCCVYRQGGTTGAQNPCQPSHNQILSLTSE